MDAPLQTLSAFVIDHHAWTGVGLGLATFLESLALIGAFVPATALLLATGGLIATGALDVVSVLAWSAAGAALGDTVSYALGSRTGRAVLGGPVFARHRRAIARTRLLARRFGVWSIYLGRFLGPLRAFVPVMAGMLRMKPHDFMVANLVSAIVWVTVLVSPGYFAGRGAMTLMGHHALWPVAGAVLLAGLAASLVLIAAHHGLHPAPASPPRPRTAR